ncbi:mitochondrial carrier domain-containing protein [Gymnopilus junonius]|uniref:Mitochondrial carrier domain-containing protein n=1 Tax=Gymnopilus junonius TaxID=109634 RepID=A0A9P5NJZ2_GYMJU|nr:mitochondrial carrier domain-containing protein [Gymnopilus junonius]
MATLQAGEIASSSVEEEPVLTARRALKDILFGSFAGMVSEIFEYPFDLAKVRLQAQLITPSSSNVRTFDGPLDCLAQTWREEGVRGLYRGLPAPLVGSMAETASVFVAYTAFQNAIRSFSSSPSLSAASTPPPLSIPQLALAAGAAGFLTSFVLTPIELIKCKMQVQMMNFHPPISSQSPAAVPGRIPRRSIPSFSPPTHPYSHSLNHQNSQSSQGSSQTRHHHNTSRMPMPDLAYKSSSSAVASVESFRPPGIIALIRSIVDTYGVRGLWLGHTGTLVRETGGTAAWFVTKEFVARRLVEHRIRATDTSMPKTVSKSELLPWESAVSGAIAGAMGALMFYPADTVKSAIQTEEELRPPGVRPSAASTFLGTAKKMYVRHGIKGLYAGCGMTVTRAVPSSGIIFLVYDGLIAYFS